MTAGQAWRRLKPATPLALGGEQNSAFDFPTKVLESNYTVWHNKRTCTANVTGLARDKAMLSNMRCCALGCLSFKKSAAISGPSAPLTWQFSWHDGEGTVSTERRPTPSASGGCPHPQMSCPGPCASDR